MFHRKRIGRKKRPSKRKKKIVTQVIVRARVKANRSVEKAIASRK